MTPLMYKAAERRAAQEAVAKRDKEFKENKKETTAQKLRRIEQKINDILYYVERN